MEQEFFATDVEGIENVGAVGVVFEQVFPGLRELKVVADPRDVWERTLRHSCIDGPLPSELKVEVGKRKVHNLWKFFTKLWTVLGTRKDAVTILSIKPYLQD